MRSGCPKPCKGHSACSSKVLGGVPTPGPPQPRVQSARLLTKELVRSFSVPLPSLSVIGVGGMRYSFHGGSSPWFRHPCGHDPSAGVPFLMTQEP